MRFHLLKTWNKKADHHIGEIFIIADKAGSYIYI